MQQIDLEQQKRLSAFMQARRRTLYFFSVPLGIILGILFVLLSSFSFIWFTMFASQMSSIWFPLRWQPIGAWHPLAILVYYVLLIIIIEMIYLPYVFYIGYVLRKRYKIGGIGKSVWKYIGSISKVQGKRVGMWAWRIQVLYFLLAIQPSTWWLWMTLLQACELLLVAYLRPWLVARSFTVTMLPEGELAQRLYMLLKRHSTSVQRIIVISKPGQNMPVNAYSIGWGRMRQIGFSSTMWNTFSADEIEVMMAHELGHILHHDIWKRIAIKTGLWLVSYFLIHMLLIFTIGTNLYYTIPWLDVIILPFLLMCLVSLSSYSSLAFNYFSRRHEYQADEFALQETGMSVSFKTAMIRLTNANRIPIATNGKSLTTHPSLLKRLQHADEFASRQAKSSLISPQQDIIGF